MKSKILLIDDATAPMKGHIDLLRKSYTVRLCDGALLGEGVISGLARKFACAIVDVMMPAPMAWGPGTQNGFRTGVVLLKRVSEAINDAHLPVIVLTNRGRCEIMDDLALLNLAGTQVLVLSKAVTLPRDLLAAVNASVAWGVRRRKSDAGAKSTRTAIKTKAAGSAKGTSKKTRPQGTAKGTQQKPKAVRRVPSGSP